MAITEQPRVADLDERLIPAGTYVRFGLLVVLALVVSAKMMLDFSFNITGQQGQVCELAAGIDVYKPGPDLSVLSTMLPQVTAFINCESRFVSSPPWWLLVGWPCLIFMMAVPFFYIDRWWKVRTTRVRPLKEFDNPPSGFVISKEVQALAQAAGLAPVPTCVVDITSSGRSAVVLGTTRNPVVCLNLGLVARRLERAAETGDDDVEFRAVLLHEFAHIRYGDVTAARITMAVWRTFLVAVLLPYLVISAILLLHGSVVPGLSGTAATSPADERSILTVIVLAVFGYLARSDVLRNREIYADREAVRNGAKRDCWAVLTRTPGSRAERVRGVLTELGRSHPSWDLRKRSIEDPAVLFVVQPLPIFIVGVAAALIDADFQSFIGFRIVQDSIWLFSPWIRQAIVALPAALVTLVVGVGIWRAVAYARHKGTAPPSDLRTGLWLGTGMILGNLIAGQGTIHQLVPQRPEVLLLALPAATLFSCWTEQCANAWLVKWRGRIPTSAMSLGLAGGFLILCWWFAWWADAGVEFADGVSYSPSGYLRYIKYLFPGETAHRDILAVISWTQPFLNYLSDPPIDLVAVGAVWVAPLLAWTVRASTDTDSSAGLPSLRRPLRWAAAGAAATWLSVALVQVYMHQTKPAGLQVNSIYDLAYTELLFAAQVLPASVVAVSIGIRSGGFRLLTTLIATEVTVLAGFAGTFVFVSADGCIRPLATLETSCAWRPGLVTSSYLFQQVVDTAAVLGVGIAFAVYMLGFLRPSARKEHRVTWASGPVPPAQRIQAYRRGSALAGVAAISIAITGIVIQIPRQAHYLSASQLLNVQVGFQMAGPAAGQPPAPPQDASIEVRDWSNLGGEGYLSHAQGDIQKIIAIASKEEAANRNHVVTTQYLLDIEPDCRDLVALSGRARDYFVTPDAKAGPLWSAFVNLINSAGLSCVSAANLIRTDFAQQQASHFSKVWALDEKSAPQLSTAYANIRAIEARIKTVEEAGVLADYAAISTTHGPLSILSPPSDSTAIPQSSVDLDTNGNPMDLGPYIEMVYSQYAPDTWKSWEEWYAAHGFISGAGEMWSNADGSVAMIFVTRFSSTNSAKSLYDITVAHWSAKQYKVMPDPVVGGAGVLETPSNQTAYAAAEFDSYVGDYQITVLEYTKSSPDSAAAEALLLKQYDSLKRAANTRP